jgi:large subunit ribosomal protein L35
MPKMKTNRGAKKRFKLLKSGKIRRNKANKQHLLTHKSTKRKRRLRGTDVLTTSDAKLVRRLIPYG